jgi:hypothetical protein
MKYFSSGEWKMEDFDREQELSNKFDKAMKENPKTIPKNAYEHVFYWAV